VDVVLVEPQMPENIGTAARAIANTGLGRLVVVNPRTLSREIMEATATSHALPVLDKMLVAPDLLSALAPYQLVVGTTSRAGSRRGPLLTPAGLAPLALSGDPPPKTALLFGPERMGLSTADLRHCQKVVRIPTAKSAASSLNLAQAVLILGYELLLGAGGEPAAPPGVVPAPFSSVNRMYRELENLLVAIGYLPAGNPGHWLMNIKKILNRTLLTQGECDLLLGLCRQIRWAVKNLSDLPPGPEDPAYSPPRRLWLSPGAPSSPAPLGPAPLGPAPLGLALLAPPLSSLRFSPLGAGPITQGP
jgi:tRNA/rRNA methyltransferase